MIKILLIYFPRNFPELNPDIYIEGGNFQVNPNCQFFINKDNLQINYSLIIKWSGRISQVKEILDEIKSQFSLF